MLVVVTDAAQAYLENALVEEPSGTKLRVYFAAG
jgi:hypothetical protein